MYSVYNLPVTAKYFPHNSIISTKALGRGYYYPHFIEKKTEVKDWHCSGSHRQYAVESKFQNRHPGLTLYTQPMLMLPWIKCHDMSKYGILSLKVK